MPVVCGPLKVEVERLRASERHCSNSVSLSTELDRKWSSEMVKLEEQSRDEPRCLVLRDKDSRNTRRIEQPELGTALPADGLCPVFEQCAVLRGANMRARTSR